jgi:hypothetical protein
MKATKKPEARCLGLLLWCSVSLFTQTTKAWVANTAAALAGLDAKFNCLAGLDATVPADVAGGVGVAAAYSGVPAAGYAGAIAVAPAYVPAVDSAGAIIDNANAAGKTVIPLVANHLGTAGAGAGGWSRAGRYA